MIVSLVIWEDEDNISIENKINCVISTDIPRKRLEKKKGSASKDEVAPEPASSLSSDKRGDEDVV